MKLAYAILADAAQASPDGKFSILGGGLNVIYASKFPVLHPFLALVIQLGIEDQECGREHELRVELISPLRTTTMPPISTKFTPELNQQRANWPINFLFVINLPGLVFELPGKYEFHFSADGQEIGTTPLYTTLLQTPQADPTLSKETRA